ncbi:MAG: WXG100 family type VII secretion target [Demequina sp.]
MVGRIEAQPESMRSIADSLGTAAGDVQGELDTLTVHLNTISGAWTGEASQAYQAAQRDWSASMAGIRSTLQRAAEVLEVAAGNYEAAEQSVVKECT